MASDYLEARQTTRMNPDPEALRQLAAHYDTLAFKHGNTPAAVQKSSLETQEARLKILSDVVLDPAASISDFGCGAGYLLSYLRREKGYSGEYTGYDISHRLLELARDAYPDATFQKRDIFAEGISSSFDYVLVSGVFNNRINDNWGFICGALTTLFKSCKKAMAFNLLSRYVDFTDPGLFYADPAAVFHFCKEHLSPCVTIRHDYEVKAGTVPFEFTTIVYPSSHHSRTLRQYE